jgi:FtsZ-binding cell division protein ZapB
VPFQLQWLLNSDSCLNGILISLIIPTMSEEVTQNMPDGRSFEERVFARFDAIDARLQTLESGAEQRALETKPIWDRALAEILEVKTEILEVKERFNTLEQLSNQMVRKIDVLSKDMLNLRADQTGIEDRLDKLESKPVQ